LKVEIDGAGTTSAGRELHAFATLSWVKNWPQKKMGFFEVSSRELRVKYLDQSTYHKCKSLLSFQ